LDKAENELQKIALVTKATDTRPLLLCGRQDPERSARAELAERKRKEEARRAEEVAAREAAAAKANGTFGNT